MLSETMSHSPTLGTHTSVFKSTLHWKRVGAQIKMLQFSYYHLVAFSLMQVLLRCCKLLTLSPPPPWGTMSISLSLSLFFFF